MATPSRRYDVTKRLIDVAVASGVLVASSPIAAFAALRIKSEDGGPVLYKGARVGLGGRTFPMYKFRSMVVDAARIGGSSTAQDDPRLTRAGAFLRRWKIDELPQFLNVLRGEMSLVGPRPQVAQDVARYTDEERRLLSVLPGITDWASVQFRNEGEILAGHPDPDLAYDRLIRPRKSQLGLAYVSHRSLRTDLRILWLTARAILQPSRADALIARALATDGASGPSGRPAAVAGPAMAPKSHFRAITETADTRADSDQLAMAQLRHSLVAELARDRDLLDVACGSGYALPLIARSARSVTACDRDPTNLRDAIATLPAGTLCLSDAERLPFRENSFDVVACLEAIYYFQDWSSFVHQTQRLLRAGGTLVTTWPNPSRPAFHRSPSSTVYPSVEEMTATAREAGLDGACYGAFPLKDLATARRPWLDAVRRTVVRLHLIPNSLRMRMFIKRLLYRRMNPLSQINLIADPFAQLTKLSPATSTDFAMLYFVGRKDAPQEER